MKIKSKIAAMALVVALSVGTAIPISDAQAELKSVKGWRSIAVGVSHSLGIKNDGTLWQWGEITTYRGSDGGETNLSALVPEQVPGLTDVIAVAGGQTHSLALREDGTVWAWGGNHDGQLGDGNDTSRALPALVSGLTDVVAIEADWTRSFAVRKDGSVWGWGGLYYQDSDGTIRNTGVLKKLDGLKDVVSISSGYGSFVALKKDGTVWQYLEQLTQIPGVENIVQVAVGSQYTYGLDKDGVVWYWGSIGEGMSNGVSMDDDSTARKLEGATGVAAIQASAGGPLLLKKDGTVWASGTNAGGQLGNGSFQSNDKLSQVIGLKKITKIAAHGIGFRSMAIRADGTLWSWGAPYLGDGSKWNGKIPVAIASYPNETLEKDPYFVEVNGEYLQMSQPPINQEGRILVPLRAIFEAMDTKVQWSSSSSTITAEKGNLSIRLTVGEKTAWVNGKKLEIAVPPVIVNNSALVPVRFISESLGAKVDWDVTSKTITIKTV
ncbi:stalk domain-containing protein [Paenibacillus sp. 1P07SE]|uniref:stalk domain-containing protein n=1 Tax=Paenibacillus sp. 1P07SE TaxID=3132209 RepID=UPI0039A61CB0